MYRPALVCLCQAKRVAKTRAFMNLAEDKNRRISLFAHPTMAGQVFFAFRARRVHRWKMSSSYEEKYCPFLVRLCQAKRAAKNRVVSFLTHL
jgi:hypothetical protein